MNFILFEIFIVIHTLLKLEYTFSVSPKLKLIELVDLSSIQDFELNNIECGGYAEMEFLQSFLQTRKYTLTSALIDNCKAPTSFTDKSVIFLISDQEDCTTNSSIEKSEFIRKSIRYDYSDYEFSAPKIRLFIVFVYPHLLKASSENITSLEELSLLTVNCSGLDLFEVTLDTNVFIIFRIISTKSELRNELWEIYTIKEVLFVNRVIETELPIDFNRWNLRSTARRNDFKGIRIVATSINDYRYESDTKYADPWAEVLEYESGLSVNIYRDLKLMLNFTEYALSGEWLDVEEDENGTKILVDASSLQLIFGEADISILHDAMRTELAELVAQLHPTYPLAVYAFVRDIPFWGDRIVYWDPFETRVWICLACLTIGIWASMLFFIWCNSKIKNPTSTSRSKVKDFDELEKAPIMFVFGWLSQQGLNTIPSTTAALKFVILTSYMTGTILFGAYTAALVTKFSIRDAYVKSFQDLLTNKYNFIVNNRSVSMLNYGMGFESYYKTEVKAVEGNLDIIKRLMDSQTTMMYYWDSVFDMFAKNNTKIRSEEFLCNVISTFIIGKGNPTGMTVLKNSPFRETFNQKILKLKQTGLNHRYIKEYERSTHPTCLPKPKTFHRQLRIKDVKMTFKILVFGYIFSVSFLVIERLFFRTTSPLAKYIR